MASDHKLDSYGDTNLMTDLSSSSRLFLGLDLGGTYVKAGIVDDNGAVISSCSVPTDAILGPDAGVEQIVEAGCQAVAGANISMNQVVAIGLATPGTMDASALSGSGQSQDKASDPKPESLGFP